MNKNNTTKINLKNNEIITEEDEYKLYCNLYYYGYSKCSMRANTALNIFRAVDFSKYLGLPLNNLVTITFDNQSKHHSNIVFSKIRTSINRWLKRAGEKNQKYKHKPAWVFAFESKPTRLHVHWMIHINKDLNQTFITKVSKLLEKHQGFALKTGQLDFQPVNPFEDKTIANYICKGIHPKFVSFFHLQKRASFQGFIGWQRARVSQCLGPTAIKKLSFNASLQRADWIDLHPDIASGYSKPENWNIHEIIPQRTGAKSFPGYKEHWLKLTSETAYYAYGRRYNI